jgi:hypothetical protein
MEIAASTTLLGYHKKDGADKPLYDYEGIIFESLVREENKLCKPISLS